MISIRDVLLVQYSFIGDFNKATSGIVVGIITFFAGVGLLVEIMRRKDIFSYLQKVLVTILFILLFSGISISLIDKSFDIADYLVGKLSKHSLLLKGFNQALNEMEDQTGEKVVGTWKWIKYHILLGNELSTLKSFIILSLAKLILILVQATYTVAYTINYGLIILPCLFTLIYPLEDSISGAIKTTAWCMAMPFVVLFLLFILSFHLTHSSEVFDGFIVMIAFLLMLIASGYLTKAFLSGSGVSSAASTSGALAGAQLMRLASKGTGLSQVMKKYLNSMPSKNGGGGRNNGGSDDGGGWWSQFNNKTNSNNSTFSQDNSHMKTTGNEKDSLKDLGNITQQNAMKPLSQKERKGLGQLASSGHPILKRAQQLANKANNGSYSSGEWTKKEKGVAIMRARASGPNGSQQWINDKKQYWGIVNDYLKSRESVGAKLSSNKTNKTAMSTENFANKNEGRGDVGKNTERKVNTSKKNFKTQEEIKGDGKNGKKTLPKRRRNDRVRDIQREL